MSKVTLITGGSSGLGFEIAKKLSPSSQVIIISSNEDKLKRSAQELNCEYLVCDVTKLEDIRKTVDAVVEKHGRLDVLINNAGIWIEGELDSNDPNYVHKVLEVNTLGPIWFSQAVIPQMKRQKSGRIVNIISQAGKIAKAERTVYNASKFALTGFTEGLSLELAKYNIGVTGVYPWKMETKMFETIGIKKDMQGALDPSVVAEAVAFVIAQELPSNIPTLEIKDIQY